MAEVERQFVKVINGATAITNGALFIPLSQEKEYASSSSSSLCKYVQQLAEYGWDISRIPSDFAKHTFCNLILYIDQYVILLAEATFTSIEHFHIRRTHYYNVLIHKLLYRLFSFTIRTNHGKIPLIYGSKLMKVEPQFRDLVYSYYHGQGFIPSHRQTGIAQYFQDQYQLHLRRYGILYLNQLKISKDNDFKKACWWIFTHSANTNKKEDTIAIVNRICCLTMTLLIYNCTADDLPLSEYVRKVEEYYGYFSRWRPFLCFYCNKELSKQSYLTQHIQECHETEDMEEEEETKQDVEEVAATDVNAIMDRISYIMLSKLFKAIHHIYYRCKSTQSQWRADDILRQYVYQLNIINQHIADIKHTESLDGMEVIMHNVSNILAANDDNVQEESSPSLSLSLSSAPAFAPFETLSLPTKRAMVTAHYIARKLHSYFKRYHFCTESEDNYIPILDHVYIVGGAVRNYLIGNGINDLDIVVDTLKLQYLQNTHLLTYHQMDVNGSYNTNNDAKCANTWDDIPVIAQDADYGLNKEGIKYKQWIEHKRRNCKCLWYLQYYKYIAHKHADKHRLKKRRQKEGKRSVKSLFNARALSRILLNEMKPDFGSKRQGYSVFVDQHNVIRFKILSHIVLYGIDIYGQSVDITDTFNHHTDSRCPKSTLHEHRHKYPHQLYYDNKYFRYSDHEQRWIQTLQHETLRDTTYHPYTLKQDMINRDLSINALLLPLSTVITNQECFNWNREYIVDLVNGVHDIEHRILSVCAQSTVEHILDSSPIRVLRVLKYYLKLNEQCDAPWNVDDALKKGMIHRGGELLNRISWAAIEYLLRSFLREYPVDMRRAELFVSALNEYNLMDALVGSIRKDVGFCRRILGIICEFDVNVQDIFKRRFTPKIALEVQNNLCNTQNRMKWKKRKAILKKYNCYHLNEAIIIIQSLLNTFQD
eukprot:193136_1